MVCCVCRHAKFTNSLKRYSTFNLISYGNPNSPDRLSFLSTLYSNRTCTKPPWLCCPCRTGASARLARIISRKHHPCRYFMRRNKTNKLLQYGCFAFIKAYSRFVVTCPIIRRNLRIESRCTRDT